LLFSSPCQVIVAAGSVEEKRNRERRK